jgi:adenylosuccinate synthase
MGVGETAAYALAHPGLAVRVGDLQSPTVLLSKLNTVRDALFADLGELDAPPVDACMDAYSVFAAVAGIVDGTGDVLRGGPCVFEGAQGVLLDEWRGFHPYTTWSTTTVDNAMALLDGEDAYRLGVVRTYTTRHGAGPLVTEDAGLTGAFPDAFNGTGPWQGAFRVGHFDAVAHRYAVRVSGGIDALAVTHADVTASPGVWALCRAYREMDEIVPGPERDLDHQARLTAQLRDARPLLEPAPSDWPAAIGDLLERPVAVISCGPAASDKKS